MLTARTSKLTTSLIYIGTFLVSVLSFFTTYQGLRIFLDQPLALVGSLGLQSAMLGIAWNLIRFKEHRFVYTLVFGSAAVFSIFFSYTSFNVRLKEHTRAEAARAAYTAASRPVLSSLSAMAKEAQGRSQYQLQRMNDLLDMEQQHGWATVIDEGSKDPLIQEVINGARRTVDSWFEHQGTEYMQGSGRGIISNYLTSWRDNVREDFDKLRDYVYVVDSLAARISASQPVAEQYDKVNYASVHFPTPSYKATMSSQPLVPPAPPTADYVETATSGQQALRLVIEDLWPMDRLTMFALAFALVIDLIVIAMALCGSFAVNELDYMFARVERDTARRLKRMSLDDPQQFSEGLRDSIDRLRQTSAYARDLGQVLREFQSTRSRITLTRGPEIAESEQRLEPETVFERMPKSETEETPVSENESEPTFVSRLISTAGKYTVTK